MFVGDLYPWLTKEMTLFQEMFIYSQEILHVETSGNNFFFQKRISEHLVTSVELLMVYIFLPALFSSTLPEWPYFGEKPRCVYLFNHFLVVFF